MTKHRINASNNILPVVTSTLPLFSSSILFPSLKPASTAWNTLSVLFTCQSLKSFIQILQLPILFLPELRIIEPVPARMVVRRMMVVLVRCSCACASTVVMLVGCCTFTSSVVVLDGCHSVRASIMVVLVGCCYSGVTSVHHILTGLVIWTTTACRKLHTCGTTGSRIHHNVQHGVVGGLLLGETAETWRFEVLGMGLDMVAFGVLAATHHVWSVHLTNGCYGTLLILSDVLSLELTIVNFVSFSLPVCMVVEFLSVWQIIMI